MLMKKNIDDSKIVSEIYQSDKLKRYSIFIIGVVLQALAFNIFIFPSNLVFGVSGIAIVLNKIFQINPSSMILLMNIILIIASFTYLGANTTKKTIVGSILYPLLVFITSSIPTYIDLGNTEPVIIALSGAVLYGIGTGLVFKAGYTTGGSDVLKQIVSKYSKKSIGQSTIYVEGVIVTCGLLVCGVQSLIYSVISLAIISFLTDKVILGVSGYKTFQIITTKEDEIKHYIIHQLKHGVTIINSQGGFSERKKRIILCTIPTKEYFLLKEGILKIDEKAFFIVTDTYEVKGGA